MSREKALFEAREVSPPSYEEEDQPLKKYMGPEKRRQNRRAGKDRRDEVRFELGKEDRRQNQGRRRGDKNPKFW